MSIKRKKQYIYIIYNIYIHIHQVLQFESLHKVAPGRHVFLPQPALRRGGGFRHLRGLRRMDRLPWPGADAAWGRFASAGETGAEPGEALEAAGAAVGHLAHGFCIRWKEQFGAMKNGVYDILSWYYDMWYVFINDHDIYAKYYDIIWHIDDSLSAWYLATYSLW